MDKIAKLQNGLENRTVSPLRKSNSIPLDDEKILTIEDPKRKLLNPQDVGIVTKAIKGGGIRMNPISSGAHLQLPAAAFESVLVGMPHDYYSPMKMVDFVKKANSQPKVKDLGLRPSPHGYSTSHKSRPNHLMTGSEMLNF